MLVSLLPLAILVHNQDQEALSLIPECTIQVKNMPQLHDSLKTVLPYFKGVKKGLANVPEHATAYRFTNYKSQTMKPRWGCMDIDQVADKEEPMHIPKIIVIMMNTAGSYTTHVQCQGHNLNNVIIPSLLAVRLRF